MLCFFQVGQVWILCFVFLGFIFVIRQRRCFCGGLVGSVRGRGFRRLVFLLGVFFGGTGLSGVFDGRNKEIVFSQLMLVFLFSFSIDQSSSLGFSGSLGMGVFRTGFFLVFGVGGQSFSVDFFGEGDAGEEVVGVFVWFTGRRFCRC